MMMTSPLKLAAALSPLMVALLAQIGIFATAADVELWIQGALWLAGAIGSAAPSFRAWWKHRALAD